MKDLNLPKKYLIEVNASVFKRFISFMIDILILNFFIIESFSGVLFSIVPKADFAKTFAFMKSSPETMSKVMMLLLIISFLIFMYFFYLQKRFRQTIGMRIMNLKLVNEDIEESSSSKTKNVKEDIKNWQVIVRNLYLLPFFPFIFLWVIDPIYLFIYGIRFSEKFSKTRLVEEHQL